MRWDVGGPGTGAENQGVFGLGKIIDAATRPDGVLTAVLLLGAVLLAVPRFSRWGRRLVAAAAWAAVAIAVLPWGSWLIRPLEDRFPPPAALPETVDGIIVLGGAVEPLSSRRHDQVSLNQAAERMTAFVTLARRYRGARLVFSGGSGSLTEPDALEGPWAGRLFAELGLPPGRVEIEQKSRTTWENAVLTRDMVRPRPQERWILITSAAAMPRAVGAFRAAGWPMVLPYPVDFMTEADGAAGLRGGLNVLRNAQHEWLGLGAYFLSGRGSALFPAPEGM